MLANNKIAPFNKIAKHENYFALALDHAKLFEKHNLARNRNKFLSMRKHLAWYIKGVPGAARLRAAMVRTNSAQEVQNLLEEWSNEQS